MKIIRCITGILIPLLTLVMTENRAQDSYKWKNRVIILKYSPSDSSSYITQKEIFSSDPEGFKDRDLVIVPLSEAIEKRLLPLAELEAPISDSNFRFFLRGKDGGLKYKQDEPVSREKLYAIIDAMPMRKSEMKKKGGQ